MIIKSIKDLEMIFPKVYNKSEKAKEMEMSRQNYSELEKKIKANKNLTSFRSVLSLVEVFGYELELIKKN